MGNKRTPFIPKCYYHIYNHGNGSDNIFRNEDNYYYFLRKYGEYIDPMVDTYAYCLMPNHFHFFVRIDNEEKLFELFSQNQNSPGFENREELNLPNLISRRFGNFLNAYAKAFNNMYDRKGSLFLENIKRKKIEDEKYFTNLIHYIHYNPVYHGFVDHAADWEYSSYHAYQMLSKQTRLKRSEVLEWFGGKHGFDEMHYLIPKMEFGF